MAANIHPKCLAPNYKELAEIRLPTEIKGVLDSAFRALNNGEPMSELNGHQQSRIDAVVRRCAVEIALEFQGVSNSWRHNLRKREARAKPAKKKHAGHK